MDKQNNFLMNTEYKTWLKTLKQQFQQVQIRAAAKVNSAMLEFYWKFGLDIIEKQKKSRWGEGFLIQLSRDLTGEFPEIKGFSYRNIVLIKQWYLFYNHPDTKSETSCFTFSEKNQQPAGQGQHKNANAITTQLFQIPWGHNIKIIQKCQRIEEALFYVKETIRHGWSRAVLTHQIESGLYQRQGRALTNFETTLPKAQSDLAKEMIKDPYKFDFLGLGKEYNERDLENALLDHITKFLLELGGGFAFVGKQKPLQVGEKDFIIDLLFYHTIMHCYIVIELKVVDFEPEFAGKLNFYLKAIDKQVKTAQNNRTIGLLICKSKDQTVVEYALSDIYKP
ncbi:MAG: YhcG family protein, partial [Fidelibacterota bacterium]